MTYFDLVKDYEEIMNLISENEGEITDEIAERLTINKSELNSKIDSSVRFIGFLNAKNEYISDEIAKLQKYIEKNEKTKDIVKHYMIQAINKYGALNKSGNSFVDTTLNKVTVTKSKKVIIIDEDKIPDNFVTFSVKSKLTVAQFRKLKEVLGDGIEGVATASLTQISDALKNDEEISFAQFKINENLKIS